MKSLREHTDKELVDKTEGTWASANQSDDYETQILYLLKTIALELEYISRHVR